MASGIARNTDKVVEVSVTAAQVKEERWFAPPDAGDDEFDVAEILQKHAGQRGGLIAVLADIQSRWGYLPESALRSVSAAMDRPLADVYGIATFYRAFSLTPRGEHLICVCLGTACHVRGGPGVAEEIGRQLGIHPGQTTDDGRFTLETVNCLGACALGPVVVIDGHYYSKVTRLRVAGMLEDAREGRLGTAEGREHRLPIEVACPRCNHSLMDAGHPIDERPSIRVTVGFGEDYGHLRLSSWFGSQRSGSESEIPAGRLTDFLCPYCHQGLTGTDACPECEAPLVTLLVRGGGAVRLCSRQGCPTRRLDLP